MNTSNPAGRSTSQISIYDYPEHLNPFYEDENHKRIRFWKIGKNKNNNGQNSRRGSFSLGGLKEMWAFKSFRLRKKSSSLGINKTSESPPTLRRNIHNSDDENHYGTYDPRMRHTYGIGNSNTINGNFLRNVPYRASLQDMKSTQNIEQNGHGFGFKRNDLYRNTIQPTARNRISNVGISTQTTPRRYVYRGSITPQPRLRSENYDDDYSEISRGSSQMSVSSKNPFEEDDDDIVIGKMSNLQTGNNKNRKQRKKRQAPPPPVPIPKVINEEPQANDEKNENAQITNLAVEIQNFVKSSDNNECLNKQNQSTEKIHTVITSTKNLTQNEPKEKSSENHLKNEKYIIPLDTPSLSDNEKEINIDEVILRKNKISDDVNELKIKENCNSSLEISKKSENEENDCLKIVETKVEQNDKCDDNSQTISVAEVKIETLPKRSSITSPSRSSISSMQVRNVEKVMEIMPSPSPSPSSTSKEALDVEIELNNNEQSLELKITESTEDLSEMSEKSQKSETCNEIINVINYIPLNNDDDDHNNSNINNDEEIKKMNLETETIKEDIKTDKNEDQQQRRRSVREIIESINRNQKLLKINQTSFDEINSINNHSNSNNNNYYTLNNNYNENNFQEKDNNVNDSVIKAPPRRKHETKDKAIYLENSQKLSEQEKEIENMINEMEVIAKTESSKYENDTFDKINNNDLEKEYGNVFKKCVIKKEINSHRESSPTSSNLDWNPVPKPKRTKKLSVE